MSEVVCLFHIRQMTMRNNDNDSAKPDMIFKNYGVY